MAARASAKSLHAEPYTFHFADDGEIPNNPKLPLVIYRGAYALKARPEDTIEASFRKNGWGEDMWRYGIFPYPHFHSRIHEVLGVARGRAKVRFGGKNGEVIEIGPGDVAILPAGTGHQCVWSSEDFCVVGAYPPEGFRDIFRGSKSEHAQALKTIPAVPLPKTDPVYGKSGPLLKLWQ